MTVSTLGCGSANDSDRRRDVLGENTEVGAVPDDVVAMLPFIATDEAFLGDKVPLLLLLCPKSNLSSSSSLSEFISVVRVGGDSG
jgi:hypothetical protein